MIDRYVSFNTQPPKGGWPTLLAAVRFHAVSTHSRLKAAGEAALPRVFADVGFNTQPPKGGWARHRGAGACGFWFQHTAA